MGALEVLQILEALLTASQSIAGIAREAHAAGGTLTPAHAAAVSAAIKSVNLAAGQAASSTPADDDPAREREGS